MAIKPLTLVSLSADQLHANNLLCGRYAQFSSQLHGQPVTITLAPIATDMPPVDFTLTVRIEGVDTPIQLSRSLFSAITLGKTPVAGVIDQLPEPLLMGSMQVIFERLLKDLKALLQKDVQLIKVNFSAQPVTPAWSVIFELNGNQYPGILGMNSQNKSWIESLPGSDLSAFAQLPLLLTIEAGRTFLSSVQVHRLQKQDVILFDHAWHQDRQHLFIKTASEHGFLGKLHNGEITLIKPMEAPMSDDLDDFDDDDEFDDDLNEPAQDVAAAGAQQASQPVADQPDLKSVPVQLTFDLGKQEIPLGHMSQLVPGFTFQLNRAIANPVVINANGKPLAEGELVDVNGQLGTRITKIL
ncbi:MAG: type III secretion system cytoplasmic ring protein SctQ [Endozoicomonadaceae bacterium]|nr:type III secretion system cytoplasmic ring protein SctQ [Endozoicomonadaceae bacterium]MCY4330065.1 type III secretion system cytoplasmic ring protein SctQ [Endozoicomonadaceae bacterium]